MATTTATIKKLFGNGRLFLIPLILVYLDFDS
jgi:hypothetical protein